MTLRGLVARQNILKAALKLTAKKGIEHVTLLEAGEMAGYSRSLPTHYFRSRDELIVALAEHVQGMYRDYLADNCVDDLADLDSVMAPIVAHIDETRVSRQTMLAFHAILTAGLHNPLLTPIVAEMTAEAVKRMADQIRLGMDAGLIRADINADVEAPLVLATMRGIMLQWLVAPRQTDLPAIRASFTAALRERWRIGVRFVPADQDGPANDPTGGRP